MSRKLYFHYSIIWDCIVRMKIVQENVKKGWGQGVREGNPLDDIEDNA